MVKFHSTQLHLLGLISKTSLLLHLIEFFCKIIFVFGSHGRVRLHPHDVYAHGKSKFIWARKRNKKSLRVTQCTLTQGEVRWKLQKKLFTLLFPLFFLSADTLDSPGSCNKLYFFLFLWVWISHVFRTKLWGELSAGLSVLHEDSHMGT